MAAAAAKSASDIAQLQRGLALASIDANDFATAQQAIAQSSSTLAIPLEQVYRQFTQLRVNTKEYGMSIKETQEIFEGVVLAVSSVGGSMEDVDGAMRAVVQIFSKGKVQAEELRGQLGERFPGAVVKFAQANKMSFEELQVALEQGKVTVGDFVEFAKKNYQDYAKFSEQIATAPEFAGRRLEKAMSDMQIAIGSALGPAGAAFQDFATEAIKSITDFVTENRGLIIQVGKDFSVIFSGIANAASTMGQMIMKVLGPVYQYIGEVINRLRIMTGTATASTARAEMDASFALMKKHGPGRTRFQQGGIGYMSDKIEYDKAAARYAAAEKQFKATGGSAAMAASTTPQNLTFGGPGAGIKLDAIGSDKPGKEKKTRLSDYSSKMIEVLRARLKEEKLAIETSDQLTTRQKELDIASREYEYGLKIIEEQLKQVREEKGKMSEADAKLAMAEANQTAISERSSLKYEYNKAILGDLFGITEDYEKQIQQVTLEISALNTAEGEITKTQQAELALIEQLKGVREEDISLTEAKKNKIMELAGELDRLLGIEKEVRKEQELRQSLENKQTEMGVIGGGLRAGFTGSAAGVFERVMAETEGDVDYATKLANMETAAMQLRAVFEGLQGAIQGVSGAFANVLTEGVANMISGTATAKEVFANFLQSVGQALSQAAAQMIATYIAIGIAKMFAGLSGGSSGGATPSYASGKVATNAFQSTDALGLSNSISGGGAFFGASAGTFGGVTTGYANGGIAPGGFRAFANGGVVSGPTLGLVGEGKYNEAIVPLPDGKSIPVQLGTGSARDLLGGASNKQSTSPVLSMSFQTTKFGNNEYVDVAQLQAAMAETRKMAAREGAAQGSQLALNRLKNSPGTRRQIGLR
jgi:tape measure domain-containing protein